MKVVAALSILLLSLNANAHANAHANAKDVSMIRCGIQGAIIVRLTDGSIIEYRKDKNSVRFPDWHTRVTFDVQDFRNGSTRIKFYTDDPQKGRNYNIATFNTTGPITGKLTWERRDPWGARKSKNYSCTY